jgi:hypothetical protein
MLTKSVTICIKLFLKIVEELTACHTARLDATANTLDVELLGTSAVDIQHLEDGCEAPDVVERN